MPARNRKTLIESSRRIGESTSGWKSSATCMGICAEVMNQPTAVAVATISMTTEVVACRAGAHGEQALEGQLTVIQGTHGNGIHAGERAAFRGREDAEPDAAKQQHGHHECGHGVPDDLRGSAFLNSIFSL